MTNKKTGKNTQRLDKFVSSMTPYSRSDVKTFNQKIRYLCQWFCSQEAQSTSQCNRGQGGSGWARNHL